MFTSPLFPAGATEARRIVASAYDAVRTHVHRIGDVARRPLARIGAAAGSYVGAKIEQRVRPPIVAALAAAGVALAVAPIAVFRR